MKTLLAAFASIILSAGTAFAACGHATTAQSTAPELVVAEDATPMTPVPEGIDETLTGSTGEDALIIRKPAPDEAEAD